jgi:hypothetical protein
MLDGKAYKALSSYDTDPDLVPRLHDPALLNAFAALADDLRTVMRQVEAPRSITQNVASGAVAFISCSTFKPSKLSVALE